MDWCGFQSIVKFYHCLFRRLKWLGAVNDLALRTHKSLYNSMDQKQMICTNWFMLIYSKLQSCYLLSGWLLSCPWFLETQRVLNKVLPQAYVTLQTTVKFNLRNLDWYPTAYLTLVIDIRLLVADESFFRWLLNCSSVRRLLGRECTYRKGIRDRARISDLTKQHHTKDKFDDTTTRHLNGLTMTNQHGIEMNA